MVFEFPRILLHPGNYSSTKTLWNNYHQPDNILIILFRSRNTLVMHFRKESSPPPIWKFPAKASSSRPWTTTTTKPTNLRLLSAPCRIQSLASFLTNLSLHSKDIFSKSFDCNLFNLLLYFPNRKRLNPLGQRFPVRELKITEYSRCPKNSSKSPWWASASSSSTSKKVATSTRRGKKPSTRSSANLTLKFPTHLKVQRFWPMWRTKAHARRVSSKFCTFLVLGSGSSWPKGCVYKLLYIMISFEYLHPASCFLLGIQLGEWLFREENRAAEKCHNF